MHFAPPKLAMFDNNVQWIASSWILKIMLVSSVTGTQNDHHKEIFAQNIRYYETIDYNATAVHKQHSEVLNSSIHSAVSINFWAFQRNFQLSLYQHRRLFTKNVSFRVLSQGSESTSDYDPRTTYTGTVKGDPNSFVMGHLIDGRFDGSFYTLGETFHLEPIERYTQSKTSFHSIIFPATSVKFNFSKIQRKIAHFKDLQKLKNQVTNKRVRHSNPSSSDLNSCTVYLAADHLFFKEVGSGSESVTVAEMVYHVAMADKIFRGTDFNQDGGPGDGVGFVIAAVTVFKEAQAEGSLASPDDISILSYLTKWSEIDHDDYCLALLFTYRDFPSGALGLAWIASTDQMDPGGICSPETYLEGKEEPMYFNTGVVTLLNYGARVPRKATVITVAHELGHSFGSEHDPATAQCSPGGQAGNFIMYPKASDGHEPNNYLFSSCSKQEVSSVISARGPLCFIAHNNGSYCGNKIVEEYEDCDCGSPEECLVVDKCCVARNDAMKVPGCTIQPGKQCSNVAGKCCAEDCTFISASQRLVCQAETECSMVSICNGQEGRCPQAESKPNNVTCNAGLNTCQEGACIGTICALYGTNDCECHQNREEMCHVCCNGSNGVCISAQHFLGRVILKRPGSTCKHHQGYCDEHGLCVTVDSEDQLNTLREVFRRFFTKETMGNLWSWMTREWYYAVIIILGIFLIVILLKFTSHRGSPLLNTARRAILPYMTRNHLTNEHVTTRQLSVSAEFYDASEGEDHGDESRSGLHQHLWSLFPDVTSHDLQEAIWIYSSEQDVINHLLNQGYTLKRD